MPEKWVKASNGKRLRSRELCSIDLRMAIPKLYLDCDWQECSLFRGTGIERRNTALLSKVQGFLPKPSANRNVTGHPGA